MIIDNLPDPSSWAWRVKKANIKLKDFLKEAGVSRIAFYSKNPTMDTIRAVECVLQKKGV